MASPTFREIKMDQLGARSTSRIHRWMDRRPQHGSQVRITLATEPLDWWQTPAKIGRAGRHAAQVIETEADLA